MRDLEERKPQVIIYLHSGLMRGRLCCCIIYEFQVLGPWKGLEKGGERGRQREGGGGGGRGREKKRRRNEKEVSAGLLQSLQRMPEMS